MKKAPKASTTKLALGATKTTPQDMSGVPTHDEEGTPIEPSHPNDNITYIPAHHPITGQPGFMIHYPADIHFTTFESAVEADHLMRMLRRQIAWAEQEADQLKRETEELEKVKREEWMLKEVLLEAVMAAELSRAAPGAIALSKTILDQTFELTAEQVFAMGSQAQAICYSSKDHLDSVAAFLERSAKRKGSAS